MSANQGLSALVIGLILCSASLTATGDVIELRDGRTFEGRIVWQHAGKIKIDCMIAGMRSELEFRMAEVAAVKHEELPEDFFEKRKDRHNDTRESTRPSQRTDPTPSETIRYTVIPLHGVFGEQVQAEDVQTVLERATRTSDVIVFDIDSPGGKPEEAQHMIDVMSAFADDLRYIALVRNARNEAATIVFSCHELLIQQGAVLGASDRGGVPSNTQPAKGGEYGRGGHGSGGGFGRPAPRPTPPAAPINDAPDIRQQIERAESLGWNPAVVRAMLSRPARLVGWFDARQQPHLADLPPDNQPDVQVLDDERTLLAITSNDAAFWQLCPIIPKDTDIDDLGETIAPEARWKRGSRYGHVVHEQAVEQWDWWKDAVKGRVALERQAKAFIVDATASDPDRASYPKVHTRYWSDTAPGWVWGYLPTDEAWDRWYGNTDRAIRIWQRAGKTLEELERIESLAEYYYDKRLFNRAELEVECHRCADEIKRLRANRARGPKM